MQAVLDFIQDEYGNLLNINISLPIAVKKKNRYYTVYSPNLKTIGYSNESVEAALKHFEESLDVFFRVHISRNTLHTALEKLKWSQKFQRSVGTAPRKFRGHKSFNVPLELLGASETRQYSKKLAIA